VGFSAQKPLTRATQRDPQKIGLAGAGLSVNRGAGKRDKAVIYWSDETGICKPGSDRQRLRAKRTDADPDADGTEVLDEYDRRR